MTASYWIVKYVADPIRNETKNVGVILSYKNEVRARFFGERDDGTYDGRIVKGSFETPDVYRQWVTYWRKSLSFDKLSSLTSIMTKSIYVAPGGEITDVGSDAIDEICAFVYSIIVAEGPMEAYKWNVAAALEAALSDDVTSEFVKWGLLDDMPDMPLAHPVKRSIQVAGKSSPHTPSYSQKNGKLYVMEHIDLGLRQQKSVRERAGWMAFMFTDIARTDQQSECYSLVRPEKDDAAEVVQFARSALGSTSVVINWADDNERGRFLTERQIVALSVGQATIFANTPTTPATPGG